MKTLALKEIEFNNFRFAGLDWYQYSNKYLTANRISENLNKIIVKVGDNHLIQTKFGYALILDYTHVVFLTDWQVSRNYYGNEVLLNEDFFNVKEWGTHENFSENNENLSYQTWVEAAKAQETAENIVRWEL